MVTVCQATLTTASAQGVLTEAGNLRFAVQTGHAREMCHTAETMLPTAMVTQWPESTARRR